MTPARIRAILTASRMTQPEFARAVGVSLSTIESWLAGVRTPRGSAVKLLEQIEARSTTLHPSTGTSR